MNNVETVQDSDILAIFSVVTKAEGLLTKIMRDDPETGMVIKDASQCSMNSGNIKQVFVRSFQHFADSLRLLARNQALVHGVSQYTKAAITTVRRLPYVKQKPGALPVIARSKEYISYPDNSALMMFDHDKARPNSVAENDGALQSFSPVELIQLITRIMREMGNAGWVSTPSTSSCIFDQTGKELRGEGSGFHLYFVVEHGTDIPRFLKVLGKRLFLAGYGRVEISRSGALLFRTLIDLSVASPERLDFVAGAVCEDGLVQKLPPPQVKEGTRLNTALLPDLTPAEEEEYEAIKARLTELAKPSQAVVKEKYLEQAAGELSTERGISLDEAREIVLSRQNHILKDGDQLYFAHLRGKAVSVAEVLDNPTVYHKKPLADPLEPEYDGGSLTKALFYWNDGNPIINSFAHGETRYTFERFKKAVVEEPPREAASQPWFPDALRQGSVSRFIDTPPPPLDWIFQGTLLAKTTGMLVGPGAAGKSTLGLLMLIASATGRDILPGIFTPTRAGKVLGVFAEDDETIIHHRMYAMANQLFEHDPEARDLLRANMKVIPAVGYDVRFLSQVDRELSKSDFFQEVLDSIVGIEDLRLILLDPCSRFHGLEENDNGAGTFLVSLMERCAQQTGAAVIILHHVGKRAGADVHGFDLDAAMHQDASRGASGLTNGVRWQCNLFGLPEKNAKKIMGVPASDPGQYLALKVCKKNYGAPEPVHFLERLRGGMLRPCEPRMREIDADLEAAVKGLVLDFVLSMEGRQLTKRMLMDGKCREWKTENQAITRPVVEQAIAACLLGGELFERAGKNGAGRTVLYLSRYPEPVTELEPEAIPENTGEPEKIPEKIPEEKIPENRRIPEKGEPTVYNSSKSKDKDIPEETNRRNDALRFVSPRNCETVYRGFLSPTGEGKPSSGLNREGLPPHPEEATNAEFF